MPYRNIKLPLLCTAALGILMHFAQPACAQEQEGFRTTYSSSLTVTPINLSVAALPEGGIDLLLSASMNFVLRKTEEIGYCFSGAYFPSRFLGETQFGFGVRRSIGSQTGAMPLGGYLEARVIGGGAKMKLTNDSHVLEPLVGAGLLVGSMRPAKSTAIGFEYGAGLYALLRGPEMGLQLDLFFGLGYLFGKEVFVR